MLTLADGHVHELGKVALESRQRLFLADVFGLERSGPGGDGLFDRVGRGLVDVVPQEDRHFGRVHPARHRPLEIAEHQQEAAQGKEGDGDRDDRHDRRFSTPPQARQRFFETVGDHAYGWTGEAMRPCSRCTVRRPT